MFGEYRGIPWEARFLIYLSFVPSMVIGLIYTDLSFFLPKVQGLSNLEMGISPGVMAAAIVTDSIPI